jgi:hypothetical protein
MSPDPPRPQRGRGGSAENSRGIKRLRKLLSLRLQENGPGRPRDQPPEAIRPKQIANGKSSQCVGRN